VHDLFQDVFLALARRAPDLAPETNLHAWLLVVAANRWRSHNRWRVVDPTRWLVLDAHDEPHAAPDPSPDGAATLEQREALERLERALANLDAADRIVILLHLDDALTNADRAAALAVSEPAYRKRLERARKHLAAALAPRRDHAHDDAPTTEARR
jgi:RNA polymerase sigma-70 factor (ECF subfamily)